MESMVFFVPAFFVAGSIFLQIFFGLAWLGLGVLISFRPEGRVEVVVSPKTPTWPRPPSLALRAIYLEAPLRFSLGGNWPFDNFFVYEVSMFLGVRKHRANQRFHHTLTHETRVNIKFHRRDQPVKALAVRVAFRFLRPLARQRS